MEGARLFDGYITIYRAMLVQLLLQESPDQALTEASQLVKLQPDEAEGWHLMLLACQAKGDGEQLAALKRELRLIAAFWPKEKRRQLPGLEDDDAKEA